jgi:hypothetical protein
MKTYSLNDMVYFKITETGRAVLHRKALLFHKEHPEFDMKYAPEPWKGEWYKNQLHWILSEFGDHSYVGQELPVTDITFEEPIEEEVR